MRMVASSGKSSRSRRAICSGLHARAHRRCCRRPCRRPFQGTTGPRTAAPPGPAPSPASRSWTYFRRAAFSASFARFGRRAARSACHCAAVARYSRPPPRVAALRRSSREIVDASRPSRRAVSRTPQPWARNSAISSRSAHDRYRSDSGFDDGASIFGAMPPASRNQRAPTACDTPTSIAAASLGRPKAIVAQNRRRFSRCATPGRPGDRFNTARSARSERRRPLLIATPSTMVLRRPRESALVVATNVVQATNDKQQVAPMLDRLGALPEDLGEVETLLADTGYFSEANVQACVAAQIEPLIAIGRQPHHPPLAERFAPAPPPSDNPTPVAAMAHRLKTPEGRKLYALRKHTPEPVFGIIKAALGFRQFLLRGLDNVRSEWNLMTMAYNVKRMFALAGAT